MEGDKGGFPDKEYNAIFKNIYQNIRAYSRSKRKSGFINDCENIFTYWKTSEQSEALANNLGLFQIQLGSLGGGRRFCNFFLHLNLHKIVI